MTHAIKKFTLPVLTVLGQPNIDVDLSVLPIMITTTTLPLAVQCFSPILVKLWLSSPIGLEITWPFLFPTWKSFIYPK